MKAGAVVLGVGAALLSALAMFLAQLTAEPSAAPPAAATTEARQPSAGARFFRELGNIDPGPRIAIALTDTQALITDRALRAVMDYYLLDRSNEGRLPALRAHLQRKLPPAAAQEAVQLAERYAEYLAVHDTLLTAQNFYGVPDPGRLASWGQQRHQLRVRILGERVTEEWFGTEDAYLTQALAEAGLPQDGAQPGEDEARHRRHMQQVLRDAVKPADAGQRDYAPVLMAN